MFTVLSYLVKRNGMSVEDFVDYYERHHVPLIMSLAPAPIVYERHYVRRGDAANVNDAMIDFDVVTEIAFTDRAAFQAWSEAVGTGDAGERVAADEARFLERSRTRASVVDDRVTAGDAEPKAMPRRV